MLDEVQRAVDEDRAEDLAQLTREGLIQRLLQQEEELHVIREHLRVQQVTDALTGLANRDYFFASLAGLCGRARRFGQQVCIILVDINSFRLINEQHGRRAGDLVLTGLADLLRAIVRDYDLLARFGEDEFAVAVDNGSAQTAELVSGRILEAVQQTPIFAGDRTVPVTVTVGISLARPELLGDHPEGLVRAAVEAADVARHKGRNQSRLIELPALKTD
jgi:diguanylate cyclase (GGDEF)-like protein